MIIETINSAYELDLANKKYRRAPRIGSYSPPSLERSVAYQRFGEWEEWKPYTSCSVILGHLYIMRPEKSSPLVTSRVTQLSGGVKVSDHLPIS